MICPKCNNGFLCPAISPVPLVLTYRSFTKSVGTQLAIQCSNCSYERLEPNAAIDIDAEWSIFKREINRKLSVEEI